MPSNTKKPKVKRTSKKHACYILITCEEPTEKGQRAVKMTYKGDDLTLLSYLLKEAQTFIDQENQLEDIEQPALHIVK